MVVGAVVGGGGGGVVVVVRKCWRGALDELARFNKERLRQRDACSPWVGDNEKNVYCLSSESNAKRTKARYFGALIAGKFQAEGARGLGCFRQQGCRSTAACRNLNAGGCQAHHLTVNTSTSRTDCLDLR